jgi:hypothetical protein
MSVSKKDFSKPTLNGWHQKSKTKWRLLRRPYKVLLAFDAIDAASAATVALPSYLLLK